MIDKAYVIFVYGGKTPVVACETEELAKGFINNQAQDGEEVSFDRDNMNVILGTIKHSSGPVRCRFFIDPVPFFSAETHETN